MYIYAFNVIGYITFNIVERSFLVKFILRNKNTKFKKEKKTFITSSKITVARIFNICTLIAFKIF